MQLFTRVADLGSFIAVANEMNSTASMISKEIQKLELQLGTRLLHRTTRKVQLTDMGKGYLMRCRDILSSVNDAEAYLQQMQNSMRGKLRINVPLVLGLTDLSSVFADYMRTFPEVELDIHMGDENIDLIEHGFDLGFRASSQPFDSQYVGKPLKSFTYHVCASPNYLASHPQITQPEDLINHNCFVYSYFKGGNTWPLNAGIKVQGNLKVNNTLFIRDVLESGLGVGFLPNFVAQPSLTSGKLTEILTAVEKPQLNLYALYPNRKHLPPTLAKCIQFLEQWFNKT